MCAMSVGLLIRCLCRILPAEYLLRGMYICQILHFTPVSDLSISRSRYWCPPYTVLMFMIGFLFDAYSDSLPTLIATSMEGWKHTHPHFILYIMVPPLLFESSFNVEWGAFRSKVHKQPALREREREPETEGAPESLLALDQSRTSSDRLRLRA